SAARARTSSVRVKRCRRRPRTPAERPTADSRKMVSRGSRRKPAFFVWGSVKQRRGDCSSSSRAANAILTALSDPAAHIAGVRNIRAVPPHNEEANTHEQGHHFGQVVAGEGQG